MFARWHYDRLTASSDDLHFELKAPDDWLVHLIASILTFGNTTIDHNLINNGVRPVCSIGI